MRLLGRLSVSIGLGLFVFAVILVPAAHAQSPGPVTQTTTVSVGVGDTVLVITGTTSPGAQVTFERNGSIIGSATADAGGIFSQNFPAHPPGNHNIRVYAQDTDGRFTDPITQNVSLQEHFTTTLDVFLPPTLSVVEPNVQVGQPIHMAGSSVPNAQVIITLDDNVTFQTNTDGNGKWQYDLATNNLAPGQHDVFAVVNKPGGGQSFPTAKRTFTITAEPETPTPIPTPGVPTITSPKAGDIILDKELVVRGTAPPDIQIQLFNGTVMIGSAISDSNGNWHITLTLDLPNYELRARACNGTVCSNYSDPIRISYRLRPRPDELRVFLDNYAFKQKPDQTVNLRIHIRGGITPYKITIEWGDGKTDTIDTDQLDNIVGHKYNKEGKYSGKLTVTDKEGHIYRLSFSADTTPYVPPPDTPIAIVVEELKKYLKQTPPEVIKSIPYWLLAGIFIIALRLLWQTIREVIAARRLAFIIDREKLIAEEKDNFIALSSHYLLTPYTIMTSGYQLLKKQSVPAKVLKSLGSALDSLKQLIDENLHNVQSNAELQKIKLPKVEISEVSPLRSAFFWVPVLVVAGLTIVSNYMYGVIAEMDVGGPQNIIAQVVALVIASLFLYGMIRTRHLRKKEYEKTKRLLEHQHAIDVARNNFVKQAVVTLSGALAKVKTAIKPLPESASKHYLQNGQERLEEMLEKFQLLALIEAGGSTGKVEPFKLKDVFEKVVTDYKKPIKNKKLKVELDIPAIGLTQNRQLYEFVVKSVIDNAVKFTGEGGTIKILANRESGKVLVAINDTGQGIPEDKLPHLFKPFSRADSALQFDFEGLGFSLFLDKIIMDYLGGDIAAESVEGKGTKVQIKSS